MRGSFASQYSPFAVKQLAKLSFRNCEIWHWIGAAREVDRRVDRQVNHVNGLRRHGLAINKMLTGK